MDRSIIHSPNLTVNVLSISRLLAEHPQPSPDLIHGLLRQGEVADIVAATKSAKTCLALSLAWSVATGQVWLGFATKQGRVLYVDNELHPATLADRNRAITSAMGISSEDQAFDVLCLRGKELDINDLTAKLSALNDSKYDMIVLDALYRFLPQGYSENDNAQMAKVMNAIDRCAASLGSAFVLVHHTSKGDQSARQLTDVGAGAGSFSRAVDAHIVIRPHEQDGCAILEAVTRSYMSPLPRTIRFDWPLWRCESEVAPVAKRRNPRAQEQAKQDADTDKQILGLVQATHQSNSDLRRLTGYGESRVTRSLNRLMRAGKISSQSETGRSGKTCDRFYACTLDCTDKVSQTNKENNVVCPSY